MRFLPTQEWSCGGRKCIAKNTPDCCPHNCQNRHRFPFPPQTIPAKAGISQCRVCINGGFAPDSPFTPQTIPAKAGIYFKHGRQRRSICRQRRLPAARRFLLYAGMVQGETGIHRRIRHCRRPWLIDSCFRRNGLRGNGNLSPNPTNCRPHRRQTRQHHSLRPRRLQYLHHIGMSLFHRNRQNRHAVFINRIHIRPQQN